MHSNSQFKHAGFFIRVAAAYLNFFIFALIILLTVLPLIGIELVDYLTKNNAISLTSPFILFFLIFALQFLVDTALQGKYGFNIGKFILGLKVLDEATMKPLGIRKMFLRNIYTFVSVLPLGLGILSIGFNNSRKAVHDMFVNTIVIHDKGNKIPGFAKNIIAFFMILVFLFSIMLVPSSIASAAYVAFNNYRFANKITEIKSKLFDENPKAQIKIELNKDDQIMILAGFNKVAAEYIPFTVDSDIHFSKISSNTLKKLGLGSFKANLSFIKSNYDWSFEKKINIPFMVLKDLNDKDILIKNAQLTISDEYENNKDENIIGRDLLDHFDYLIDEDHSELIIKLSPEEQIVYSEKDQLDGERDYKLYVINKIKKDWQTRLSDLSPELIEEFTNTKDSLSNKVEIQVATHRGYVTGLHFLTPSKNINFNNVCKEFLSKMDRFRNIPKSLATKNNFTVTVTLKFSQK